MSLRSIFLLIIGALTLLAAAVTGVIAANSWSHYDRARQIVAQDGLLAAATAEWTRERGAVATLLAASADTASLWGIVRISRQNADLNFQQAMASLSENEPSLFMDALLDRVVKAFARIEDLRHQVDAAAALPVADRPSWVAAEWSKAMADLIDRAQLLRLVAGREARTADGTFDDLQMLRHFAWTAAEQASQERATIGALVSSGQGLGRVTLERLAANRGEIGLAWEMVRFLASTKGMPDEVRDAVRIAGDSYFRMFGKQRDAILDAGRTGKPYAVSAEAWFAAATAAIDSLLAVEAVAGEAAQAQVGRMFSGIVGSILLQGGLFLGGAALAAGFFLLLSRRVIEPIKRMTAATIALARGDLDVAMPKIAGDDEIAGMAAAMEVFRENAVARLRLEKDLRESRDLAEAASRTKSEFLANMSHELRTPLNAVIGFSELMKMEAHGPLNQAQYREYVEDIHGSGCHLLGIINDILDMSKIEVGQMILKASLVDVPRILEPCRRVIDGRATAAELAFKITVAPDLPPIMVDPLKVRQIVLNLLSNAVKFTPAGGQVTCDAARNEAGELVVEVTDTGIGMRPEEIAVALQPFRQVDSALSRRHEGTGLGLALARGLAELHGGRLEIDSQPQHGTRARLVLPASAFLQPGSSIELLPRAAAL